jgi:hypothetical protein
MKLINLEKPFLRDIRITFLAGQPSFARNLLFLPPDFRLEPGGVSVPMPLPGLPATPLVRLR